MNKVTCSNKRDDCLLSSTSKAPPKRRQKEEDDCICEESTDEETALKKARPRSSSRRARPRRTRVLDVETGEDRSYEEEDDTTDDEGVKLDVADRTYLLSKEQAGLPHSYSPANFFRRRSARIQERNGNGENSKARIQQATMKDETSGNREEDDSVIEGSDRFDDEHREHQSQLRIKKKDERDEELKRWIKRCQAECVRQGKRRKNN
ncbi:uncharacterized protein LOC117229736 [Megalopta genalis]|uniref:uncharacterized protein LOC117229736 n=1 Tax=Megalopta genalis TaxID=115081 RepID=UPI003FD14E8A